MQLMLDFADEDVVDAHGNQPTIDYKALYAAGFRVAIFRCASCYLDSSHGAWRLYHDKTFDAQAQAARAAGLVVGAYVFVAFNAGAPSPAEQIANAVASGAHALTSLDLPLILDVEFPGTGQALTKRSKADTAALLGQFVDEITKQTGRRPVVYTSHVVMQDDNELYGAAAHMTELAECLLWQKVPYRVPAGQPLDQVAPRMPHTGTAAWDPNGYFRIPSPWEGVTAPLLVQTQGDARGLPGGVHQADVGVAMTMKQGDVGPGVLWLRRRLADTGARVDTSSSTFDAALDGAVKTFQGLNGLVSDGIVGVATAAALAR